MINRTCIKCNITHYALNINLMSKHFNYKDKKTLRLSTTCKECDKAYYKVYNERNKKSKAIINIKKCIVCNADMEVIGNRDKKVCSSECAKVKKRVQNRINPNGRIKFKKKISRLAEKSKNSLYDKYTDKDKLYILNGLEKGLAISTMAKKLNRSYWGVYAYIKRLKGLDN